MASPNIEDRGFSRDHYCYILRTGTSAVAYVICRVLYNMYTIYFSVSVYILWRMRSHNIRYNIIIYYTYYCRVHNIFFFVMNAADLRRAARNRPMQRVRIIFVSRVHLLTSYYYNTCAVQYTYICIQKNSTLSSYTHTREFIIECKFYASAQTTATHVYINAYCYCRGVFLWADDDVSIRTIVIIMRVG